MDGSGHATKGEVRDRAQHQRKSVGRNKNYRTNRTHPDFEQEVANGQRMIDEFFATKPGGRGR